MSQVYKNLHTYGHSSYPANYTSRPYQYRNYNVENCPSGSSTPSLQASDTSQGSREGETVA